MSDSTKIILQFLTVLMGFSVAVVVFIQKLIAGFRNIKDKRRFFFIIWTLATGLIPYGFVITSVIFAFLHHTGAAAMFSGIGAILCGLVFWIDFKSPIGRTDIVIFIFFPLLNMINLNFENVASVVIKMSGGK